LTEEWQQTTSGCQGNTTLMKTTLHEFVHTNYVDEDGSKDQNPFGAGCNIPHLFNGLA
jgi:hypothetical protein